MPSLQSVVPEEKKISMSTAFLGALWAHCSQSAPRKADDSVQNLALKELRPHINIINLYKRQRTELSCVKRTRQPVKREH